MVNRFYELLEVGFDQFVPLKRKTLSSHPPWYSATLLNLKNRRNKAHKRYKRLGDATSYARFCSLRNQFDTSQSRAFQAYLDSTQDDLVRNPARFWRYVNDMRKSSGYPSLMYKGDDRTTDVQSKCDLFAEYFQSAFVSAPTSAHRTFGLTRRVDIGSLTLGERQIIDALEGIDTTKGGGP